MQSRRIVGKVRLAALLPGIALLVAGNSPGNDEEQLPTLNLRGSVRATGASNSPAGSSAGSAAGSSETKTRAEEHHLRAALEAAEKEVAHHVHHWRAAADEISDSDEILTKSRELTNAKLELEDLRQTLDEKNRDVNLIRKSSEEKLKNLKIAAQEHCGHENTDTKNSLSEDVNRVRMEIAEAQLEASKALARGNKAKQEAEIAISSVEKALQKSVSEAKNDKLKARKLLEAELKQAREDLVKAKFRETGLVLEAKAQVDAVKKRAFEEAEHAAKELTEVNEKTSRIKATAKAEEAYHKSLTTEKLRHLIKERFRGPNGPVDSVANETEDILKEAAQRAEQLLEKTQKDIRKKLVPLVCSERSGCEKKNEPCGGCQNQISKNCEEGGCSDGCRRCESSCGGCDDCACSGKHAFREESRDARESDSRVPARRPLAHESGDGHVERSDDSHTRSEMSKNKVGGKEKGVEKEGRQRVHSARVPRSEEPRAPSKKSAEPRGTSKRSGQPSEERESGKHARTVREKIIKEATPIRSSSEPTHDEPSTHVSDRRPRKVKAEAPAPSRSKRKSSEPGDAEKKAGKEEEEEDKQEKKKEARKKEEQKEKTKREQNEEEEEEESEKKKEEHSGAEKRDKKKRDGDEDKKAENKKGQQSWVRFRGKKGHETEPEHDQEKKQKQSRTELKGGHSDEEPAKKKEAKKKSKIKKSSPQKEKKTTGKKKATESEKPDGDTVRHAGKHGQKQVVTTITLKPHRGFSRKKSSPPRQAASPEPANSEDEEGSEEAEEAEETEKMQKKGKPKKKPTRERSAGPKDASDPAGPPDEDSLAAEGHAHEIRITTTAGPVIWKPAKHAGKKTTRKSQEEQDDHDPTGAPKEEEHEEERSADGGQKEEKEEESSTAEPIVMKRSGEKIRGTSSNKSSKQGEKQASDESPAHAALRRKLEEAEDEEAAHLKTTNDKKEPFSSGKKKPSFSKQSTERAKKDHDPAEKKLSSARSAAKSEQKEPSMSISMERKNNEKPTASQEEKVFKLAAQMVQEATAKVHKDAALKEVVSNENRTPLSNKDAALTLVEEARRAAVNAVEKAVEEGWRTAAEDVKKLLHGDRDETRVSSSERLGFSPSASSSTSSTAGSSSAATSPPFTVPLSSTSSGSGPTSVGAGGTPSASGARGSTAGGQGSVGGADAWAYWVRERWWVHDNSQQCSGEQRAGPFKLIVFDETSSSNQNEDFEETCVKSCAELQQCRAYAYVSPKDAGAGEKKREKKKDRKHSCELFAPDAGILDNPPQTRPAPPACVIKTFDTRPPSDARMGRKMRHTKGAAANEKGLHGFWGALPKKRAELALGANSQESAREQPRSNNLSSGSSPQNVHDRPGTPVGSQSAGSSSPPLESTRSPRSSPPGSSPPDSRKHKESLRRNARMQDDQAISEKTKQELDLPGEKEVFFPPTVSEKTKQELDLPADQEVGSQRGAAPKKEEEPGSPADKRKKEATSSRGVGECDSVDAAEAAVASAERRIARKATKSGDDATAPPKRDSKQSPSSRDGGEPSSASQKKQNDEKEELPADRGAGNSQKKKNDGSPSEQPKPKSPNETTLAAASGAGPETLAAEARAAHKLDEARAAEAIDAAEQRLAAKITKRKIAAERKQL